MSFDGASPDGPLVDAAIFDAAATDSTSDAAGDAALPDGGGAVVARGSYLVNSMAGCGDCHTPRGTGSSRT